MIKIGTFTLSSLAGLLMSGVALAAEEHGGAEHKAGLPQLDIAMFPPQLFWLAVSFALLLILMWKVGLPNVGGVVQAREAKIEGDLEQAARFKDDADALIAAYDQALADLPLQTPWQHPDSYSSYHLYPIHVKGSEAGVTQKEVYAHMQAAGIQVNLHYIPVYLQPYYAAMGFQRGHCPQAELYFKQTISIPLYAGLAKADQAYIVQQLTKTLQPLVLQH